ncbi:hypothetical protein ACFJGV_10850 [Cnuibacter sp. UC19_7]|uniref:hypothetical protein n=1 Tax=Cnuibacter sp. UC19_7 TaxID=3350166 RepID=UPI00366D7918
MTGTVDVTINDSDLVIEPRGWWKMFSLRRRFRIPRSAIVSARVAKDPTIEIPVRFRVGGTGTVSIRAGLCGPRESDLGGATGTGNPPSSSRSLFRG